MKIQRLHALLFGLSLLVSPTIPRLAAQVSSDPFASSSPAAPASSTVNPYDWFHLGESFYALGTLQYNYAVVDSIKDKYKGIRDQLVKARVSETTLTAYNAHAVATFGLPWQKGYDQWTEEERNKWVKDPTWDPMISALAKDRSGSSAANYFYWMGYEAIRVGWLIPWRLERGSKIADCLPDLKGAIGDYVWLENGNANFPDHPRLFKQLTPEVQNAIKVLAAKKSKISDDPLEGSAGLDQADVDAMVQAARTLRQAAKENKLVP